VTEEKRNTEIGWPLRLLALLLTWWEPLAFAAIAATAFNAIEVRGLPVAIVLAARLLTTILCVAAGRALLDRGSGAVRLTTAALVTSAIVQLFAATTPYFPSNRLPGQTSLYVAWTFVYYFGWLWYLARSKNAADVFR
jgi:hypothetical protein